MARGCCSIHYQRWQRQRWQRQRWPLPPRPTLADRFWAKVDRSGGPDACWLWLGATMGNGYGAFQISGKNRGAHRVAWELVHGPIPEGYCVLHHCDNPPCQNVYTCLFLGTHEENVADMIAKGRAVWQRIY